MKVLSYIIRIFLLPIGPFRKLNKSIQFYSCKRWYIKFAGPRVPEEIQTPVFFKSRQFYFLTSKCWWAEIFNSKSSVDNHEQRSTSFKKTYLSQSTPRDASAEFIVNSNLSLPHIHVVGLLKVQKPDILDLYLVTVSCSTGDCYELQADVVSSHSLGYRTPITPTNRVTVPTFTAPSAVTAQPLLGLQHQLGHTTAQY